MGLTNDNNDDDAFDSFAQCDHSGSVIEQSCYGSDIFNVSANFDSLMMALPQNNQISGYRVLCSTQQNMDCYWLM